MDFCVFCSMLYIIGCFFFFFKQKTAYEMRISDWSSDVCSSDLSSFARRRRRRVVAAARPTRLRWKRGNPAPPGTGVRIARCSNSAPFFPAATGPCTRPGSRLRRSQASPQDRHHHQPRPTTLPPLRPHRPAPPPRRTPPPPPPPLPPHP